MTAAVSAIIGGKRQQDYCDVANGSVTAAFVLLLRQLILMQRTGFPCIFQRWTRRCLQMRWSRLQQVSSRDFAVPSLIRMVSRAGMRGP